MKYIYLLISICFLTSSCETKNQKETTKTENETISTTNPTVNTKEQLEDLSQRETYVDSEYSQTNDDYEEEDYEYGEEYEEPIGGNDIPICDVDLSEFVTNITVRVPSTSGYENLYTSMPLILKNDKCNFPLEAYPYDIFFNIIPKVADTLIVSVALDTTVECSNCLEMTTINSLHRGTLYYKVSQNGNTIAHKGFIDDVIEEQDLSYLDLEIDDDFDSNYDFMNTTFIKEVLEPEYIFNSDESWKNNSNIENIHHKITSSSITITNLDSLKSSYESFIMPQKEVGLSNFLSNEEDGYFHSGEFIASKDYHLLLDTINIIFISPENKMYPVEWLTDWEEIIRVNYNPPLDDNYVTATDGEYKISKWDNDTEISLFHPDMEFGDYLVIYEAKLKGRDVYIQSPIDRVTYKKPKS